MPPLKKVQDSESPDSDPLIEKSEDSMSSDMQMLLDSINSIKTSIHSLVADAVKSELAKIPDKAPVSSSSSDTNALLASIESIKVSMPSLIEEAVRAESRKLNPVSSSPPPMEDAVRTESTNIPLLSSPPPMVSIDGRALLCGLAYANKHDEVQLVRLERAAATARKVKSMNELWKTINSAILDKYDDPIGEARLKTYRNFILEASSLWHVPDSVLISYHLDFVEEFKARNPLVRSSLDNPRGHGELDNAYRLHLWRYEWAYKLAGQPAPSSSADYDHVAALNESFHSLPIAETIQAPSLVDSVQSSSQ